MIPKFRAWNIFKKRWVKHFYITENGLIYNMEHQHRILIGAIPIKKSGLIVMQSTGLFDKNGVEIFEGDVVRVLNSLYTVFYDNEKGSYRLSPHNERWNVDYMSNFDHSDSFEVVGNIHEHPDLMEEWHDK